MKSYIAPAITLALALAACTNYSEPQPAQVVGAGGDSFSGGTGGGPVAGGPVSAGGSSFGVAGFGSNNFNDPVVVALKTPPPLAGGTMLITGAGHTALVADPDHDQLFVVDLDRPSITATIALEPGDEPGRSAEDAAGRVHVALRGGASVITIDPVAGTLIGRRQVCSYPRGIAYESAKDAVHVACAGGELVTLPAGGGNATRTLQLDLDLRDIVIDGERLLVSRFRAAELLVVEASGEVSNRIKPADIAGSRDADSHSFAPAVAWRTVSAPGGGALMVFQHEQTSEVLIEAGGYGSGGVNPCGVGGGIVQGSVAVLRANGTAWTSRNIQAVLPVDVAADPSSRQVVVASAGTSPNQGQSSVIQIDAPSQSDTACPLQRPPSGIGQPLGRVVAVGFDWQHRVVLQTREPSSVTVGERAVMLPGESVKDTGHDLFHFATSGGLACASCHPEGREDGHTWTFATIGPRRTQSVGGGIMDTKPFHWDGDMTDFDMLAHEVFSKRMSGPQLGSTHLAVMEQWIDAVPAWKPTPARDVPSAERGKTIFHSAQAACASCHTGAKLTNNTSADVGSRSPAELGRGLFQVPSLVGVRWRAPFMHQGCAGTLADRFDPECGGGDKHGRTSQLTESERTDLTNYLGTL